MTPLKKLPPPDNYGNVQGRMTQLRFIAHHMACEKPVSDDPKKGKERYTRPKDYDKKLEAVLKKLEPEFKKLERRLKKCPKPKAIVAKPKPKTKPKKQRVSTTRPDTTMKPVNGAKPSTGIAASVLGGGDSTGPLSREDALTEGVKQDSDNKDLLNFMQSSLD